RGDRTTWARRAQRAAGREADARTTLDEWRYVMSTTTMGGDRTVAGIGLTAWGMFGPVTLIVLGGLNIVNGFTAIHNSQFFTHQIVYHNLTAWGWVFLILGMRQLVGRRVRCVL